MMFKLEIYFVLVAIRLFLQPALPHAGPSPTLPGLWGAWFLRPEDLRGRLHARAIYGLCDRLFLILRRNAVGYP